MEIRCVTAADKKAWMRLVDDFYNSDAVWHPIPQSYREATFAEILARDTYLEGYLMEQAGESVGFALIAKSFSQEGGGLCLWLEELYFTPENRGKGYGSEFFAFLENRAQTLKAARLRLEVEPDNLRAQELYRRKGFDKMPYGEMVRELLEE